MCNKFEFRKTENGIEIFEDKKLLFSADNEHDAQIKIQAYITGRENERKYRKETGS